MVKNEKEIQTEGYAILQPILTTNQQQLITIKKRSDPDEDRTHNLLLRRQLLYPIELRDLY